ncbi:copper resistance CopC/CopD family protein [Bosea minatitlanensis]|uniref:Copper resistance CopC/CopD family protein n=1 Tax=Bosea minatitlanensis TaxID=128782 RepID=A0ABW0F2C5_9HYPH|nr:copper resistance protein CopC [Bosea minatitlanensis]MCT4491718.1 copper resistance protein CopC [Bosea minatitlanensis]
MPSWFRRPILSLLVLLACLGMPTLALAHAALNSAAPADGSVLAAAPGRIELVFSEPVSPLALRLVGPDGAARTLDRFVLKDSTLVISPPAGLANGTYTLSWRVVSEDGHPVGGALVFSIGAPGGRAPATDEPIDRSVRLLVWLSRLGLYLGLFLGCGAAASRAWLGPLTAGAGRFATAMAVLGLASLPVALGAQGLDALGASVGAFAQPAVWKAAAATSYVWTVVLAAAALAAALAGRWLPGKAAAGAGAASVLLAGLALASSGHASAAQPQWLMRPAVFLHGSMIAAWAGALVPLAFALRGQAGGGALRRFSGGIAPVVALLLLSGTVLALVQVGTPAALLATAYGRVLLAKLFLVALAFLLAGFNRWRLTQRAEAGDRPAARLMRQVIAVELAVLVAVFGTAALWRFTPPPRAIAAAQAQPASVHIHTLQAMADVTVSPGRAGPVAVDVVLMDGAFGPLPARELGISFSNPAAGIEPIERRAQRGADGVWRVDDLTLPVPGRWEVELEILISDFEMRRIRDSVVIRP